MTQNAIQFERPLLRMGSIAFLAGIVIVIVSTGFHPSREDPANHPLVFMEYANSDPWIAIHIGQFAGGIVFAGGYGALYLLLVRSESSTTSVLALLGFAVAIMTASVIAILQAVDGIALKMAVDSWAAAAPAEEKAIIFRVAEGIRWIEYGTNSIFRILQGIVAVIFGVAIVKSMLPSRWIGGAGVIVGAVTIIAGLEVAYLAFAYTNIVGLRGISMIIYSIWIGILGGFMWRKAMSKSNHKI